jgi:hypothetical protein
VPQAIGTKGASMVDGVDERIAEAIKLGSIESFA